MTLPLKTLSIHGFKSIKSLDNFSLGPLTVLIGANGAGKSNFVDFFRMVRAMAGNGLQGYIQKNGGADSFFFMGPKYTREIYSHLDFGDNGYKFSLEPTAYGKVLISEEWVNCTAPNTPGMFVSLGTWNDESCLKAYCDNPTGFSGPTLLAGGVSDQLFGAISRWAVYHFHDTSLLSPVRRDGSVRDRGELRQEAENLAAFLLYLREKWKDRYTLLRDTIRLIAPFFDDFVLVPESNGKDETVRLEWRQKGSDFPFQPSQFSDGTLRFICLATALQQPNLPTTMVIDEPELGLHPYAISLLANLIESAAEQTQIIVSTQSPLLLDHFQPETVAVVQRQGGETVFDQLDTTALHEWMEEYSISELWRKNVFQGGPSHE